MSRELRPRPNPLPLRNRLAGNLFQAPLFCLGTIGFGALSLLASLFEEDGRMQHRIARAWAITSMKIAWSPVTVVGDENFLGGRAAVYAANHISYMDTPLLFSAIPFQFRILAKASLWKVPFIGWHLNRSGQIPVGDGGSAGAISSLSAGVKALKAGMPLVVFPEGGRAADGKPRRFMNGPAYMAIRAGVPLIPMAIVGTFELLPMHTRHYFPVPVKLVVGESIDASRYSIRQVDELTERLRDTVAELYYSHRWLKSAGNGANNEKRVEEGVPQ